jgi:3-hydroxyisobutyrate dehydrogenase
MASPRGGAAPVVALLGAGGAMGGGMARNLIRAGLAVRAWNRTAAKLEDLASGEGPMTACATPAEAASGADVVLTMLSDGDAALAAMDGAEGAAAGAADGALWVQAGTIGVEGIERCAGFAARNLLILVDAPVLGTKEPAERGELVVLASGPDDVRDRLDPVFDAIGKRTMWVGEAGVGSRLKVVVNTWVVAVVEGVAEMLALAEGLGLDPALALEAISDGPLDLPYLQMKGKAMLDRDFTTSFRLALAAKDAGLAVRAAVVADLALPMLEAIAGRLTAAAEKHGDEDLAAVYLASTPTS